MCHFPKEPLTLIQEIQASFDSRAIWTPNPHSSMNWMCLSIQGLQKSGSQTCPILISWLQVEQVAAGVIWGGELWVSIFVGTVFNKVNSNTACSRFLRYPSQNVVAHCHTYSLPLEGLLSIRVSTNHSLPFFFFFFLNTYHQILWWVIAHLSPSFQMLLYLHSSLPRWSL